MMGYGRLGYGVGHMTDGGAFGFGGLIFMFIAAALVTGLIIWLVSSRKHGSMHAAHYGAYSAPLQSAGPNVDEAMRIARERLAKGEIDADQYSSIATALKG